MVIIIKKILKKKFKIFFSKFRINNKYSGKKIWDIRTTVSTTQIIEEGKEEEEEIILEVGAITEEEIITTEEGKTGVRTTTIIALAISTELTHSKVFLIN